MTAAVNFSVVLLLFCCCSVRSQEVLSQTQNAPTQCITQNVLSTDVDWIYPEAALSLADSNTTYTNTSLYRKQQTTTLIITDFSFNISLDALIVGVGVSWVKWASGTELVDGVVSLVKGGAITATNLARSTPWPVVSNSSVHYGNTSELWGQTWTPEDINSKSFGAAISARMPPGAKSTAVPYIDSVEITVYYSFPVVTTGGVSEDSVASDINTSDSAASHGTSVGGIVAGIVVAVAVIAVTVAVVVVLLKRRKNTKKQAETYLPSYKDSGESNPNSIIIHTNTPTSSPTSNNNEDIYHNTNNSNNTKGDDNSSSTELPAVSSSSFSSSNYNDSNSRAAARKQNREEEQSVYDTMPRTKSMAFLLGAFQVKKASGESAGGVELPRVDGEETTTKATDKNGSSSGQSLQLVRASWQIGFDELKIGETLGSGSFGVVYRGQWRGSDIAVKQLLKHKMSTEDTEKFIYEGKLLAKLRPHCNIVQFLGLCTETDKPFCIVTEYMKGGSLYHLLHSDTKIKWSTATHIMKGVAAGMLHLQTEGIIHRDLAARNVLLTADMEPKISDFGMSRDREEDASQSESAAGPLKWMSPESLAAGIFSSKSDVWSFGVVLYEIVTRQTPYSNLTAAQAAAQVVKKEIRLTLPKTDAECAHHNPSAVEEVMESCLQYSAEDRPDFAEIAEKFQTLE